MCSHQPSARSYFAPFTLAAAGAVVGLSTMTSHAAMMDATLIEDMFLDNAQGNVNTSGQNTMLFRTFSSVWRNPLIQFALPTLAAGDEVVKVELILQSASATAGTGGTPDIEVLGTATPIDLSTATYNSLNPTFHTGGQAGTSALLWTSEWTDFSSEAVIPGADFASGDIVTYSSEDATQGLRKFVQDNISQSSNTVITLGLGFITREGVGGTTSAGWTIHAQEGSGNAPILRITTAPIPEPASLALLGLGGMLMLGRRNSTAVAR